jgi:hypothetical protein
MVDLLQKVGIKSSLDDVYKALTTRGVFLLSLKSLLETGKGAPWPIKLDSWE